MKRTTTVMLSIIMAAVLVLSGCSPLFAAPKDSVTVAIVSEWPTLDPAIGNDLLVFSIMFQFYDTLVRQEKDGSLVPALAASWTISDDGLEYTFKLREGVKFHNGETMTADDVVFSYNRSAASAPTARITGMIEKTEKIDDNTVKVTLKYPYGPFLGCVASINLGVVSQKAVEEAGEDVFARNPVGTGPYQFVEWRPGDRLIMKSFPDYYRGEAAIKNAAYRVITDASTTTVALEKGEVDMILQLTPSEKINIVNNSNLYYNETPSASYFFVAFNMEEGRFTNKLLRDAVSYAIDRESVIIGALEGNGAPVTTPFTPICFGYPKEGFEANPYDQEKAKALLTEAGYPDGLTITLKTMESPNYSKAAEIVQEQLRQVGFDCQLELMERGAFLSDAYTNSQFEIMLNSLTALIPDADLLTYTRFHSAHKGGGMNFALIDIPEMDATLEVARQSTDPNERLAAYLKVCQMNKDLSLQVPLYAAMNGTACAKDLAGLQASPVQRYYLYDLSWK